jgi:hypothetical protein
MRAMIAHCTETKGRAKQRMAVLRSSVDLRPEISIETLGELSVGSDCLV